MNSGIPYLSEYLIAREITNGMWFLASTFLLVSMLRYLVPRMSRNPVLWRHGIEVRLAWGICLIAAGTALRAGWIWALLVARQLGASEAAALIEGQDWVAYLAIGLGVWGAVCSVKAITEATSSHHRSPRVYFWSWLLGVVTTTVALPLIVNWLIP